MLSRILADFFGGFLTTSTFSVDTANFRRLGGGLIYTQRYEL